MESIVRDEIRQKESALERRKRAMASDMSFGQVSDALFGRSHERLKEIPASSIDVKPQVRKTFIDSEIEELSRDIAARGLLNPVTVFAEEDGRYRLVCGEKRYRACVKAGLSAVTCYIIDPPHSDIDLIALQIVENLHRSDPPLFEIAAALGIMNDSGASIPEIMEKISMRNGKTWVYEMLRFNRELDNGEKERFADFPKQFLLQYCQIKKKRPEAAMKIFQDAEKSPRDRVIRYTAAFLKDLNRMEEEQKQAEEDHGWDVSAEDGQTPQDGSGNGNAAPSGTSVPENRENASGSAASQPSRQSVSGPLPGHGPDIGDYARADDRQSSEIPEFLRVILNMPELDKINPGTSGRYAAYMASHPGETEQSLMAAALVWYLDAMEQEQGGNN